MSTRSSIPAALLLGLTLGACTLPETYEPPEPARGLVVVVVDTLRADHVSSYGYERETTPHLDRLAEGGVRFEAALSPSNWTVPAVASLLSSRYPAEHGAGVPGEVKALGEDSPPLPMAEGVETLADLLSGAGFATGLFSANPYLYGRFQRGFDTAETGWRGAGELTDLALEWLRGAGDGRFFLHVQYMDLHQPIRPPAEYAALFAGETGPPGEEHEGWKHGRQEDLDDPAFLDFKARKLALYDGSLRWVDAQIGRLLEALEELGAAAETVVVVTSDHGEEFWDHARELRALGGDPRGIWGIGHGHSMYQELLRVPLVIAGPGLPEGRRIDCPVSLLDVAPTLLALAERPVPEAMRGRDLRSLLGDRPDPALCRDRPLLAEAPAYGPDARALLYRGHKLIVRGGEARLYDLRSDPEERRDLAAEKPQVVAEMAKLLEAAAAAATLDEGAEPTEIDDATREQLEALGYL